LNVLLLVDGAEEVLVVLGRVGHLAVDDLADGGAADDLVGRADVVCVRVRGDEDVNRGDAVTLHGVEDLFAVAGVARVNEHRLARRRDDEDGVALADVEHDDAQLAARRLGELRPRVAEEFPVDEKDADRRQRQRDERAPAPAHLFRQTREAREARELRARRRLRPELVHSASPNDIGLRGKQTVNPLNSTYLDQRLAAR
jgi:hypothetical protein